MKIFFLLFALLGFPPVLRAEPPTSVEMEDEFVPVAPATGTVPSPAELAPPPAALRILHPPAGAGLPAVRSSFVFGSAAPAGRLTVNGKSVPIHPGGGWITQVAYTPGVNVIQAELRLSTSVWSVSRTVTVAGPPGVPPVKPLTVKALGPEVDQELRAGDLLTVTAVGSPGQEASFQIPGVKGRFPMAESAAAKGTYRGGRVVRDADDFKEAAVRVTLSEKNDGHRVTAEAPGKLWRMDETVPWVVEVSTDLGILRAAPGPFVGEKAGYLMFPPPGTRLWVTGRRGGELRVRLAAGREAWIGTDEVRSLPAGTPPPRTLAGAVSVESAGRHTLVRLGLGQRVPFEVRPSDDGRVIDVLFYGVASNTDWIHYRAPEGSVRRVEWFQDDTDLYRLRIHARPFRWWGLDARYESGAFVLELRRPPLAPLPSSLVGLRVVVDAGHSPDIGSRGPTGLLEKDANLAIAKCLEKKLTREGADVVMLRNGASERVALYDRPKMAWAARGDVLLSVHNNALPEGADPFERNGYGVYYFQPRSEPLAREIHAAYGEIFGRTQPYRTTRLRDDGLHYGNLALPRTPQMPAVLTESAYIIWPAEEALLKTESFQCDCAEAMVRGLKRYVRKVREADASAAEAPR